MDSRLRGNDDVEIQALHPANDPGFFAVLGACPNYPAARFSAVPTASAMASANEAESDRKAPKSASATSSQTSAFVTSGLKAESVIATTGTLRCAAAAARSAVTG